MRSKGQATLGRRRQGPRAHEAGGWREGGGLALYVWGDPNGLGLPVPAFVLTEATGKEMLQRLVHHQPPKCPETAGP